MTVLRPHHLLCLMHFIGKGYNDGFAKIWPMSRRGCIQTPMCGLYPAQTTYAGRAPIILAPPAPLAINQAALIPDARNSAALNMEWISPTEYF